MKVNLSQANVLQVNVGRSWAAHEAALQLAFEQQCAAVLIQEPWTLPDRSRRLSKHHPAYAQFSPVEDWTSRPRTLTYTLKHPLLSAVQVPLGPPNRDLLAVSLSTTFSPAILLVNVYSAPFGSVDSFMGIDCLTQLTIPPLPCLVAGDFNIRHPSWETTGPTTPRAVQFLEWSEEQNLSLTLLPDTCTHGNSMIDLAWANSALQAMGVSSEVPEDIPPLADHEAVFSVILWGRRKASKPAPPFKWNSLDEPLFNQALHRESTAVSQNVEDLPAHPTPSQLDDLTTSITGAINTAIEASTHRAHPRTNGHCWWSPECADAVKSLRQTARSPASSEEEKKQASKNFKRTIRRNKRLYWRNAIDNMKCTKDVFQAVKWNRTEGNFPISPLREGDTIHVTPSAKADFLCRALLQKDPGAADIEPKPLGGHSPSLPFPPIKEPEARRAVSHTKNSTPGQDGIPSSILKKAWPLLGKAITFLYNQCLEEGWHPTPFRQATLVAIPKPGKRDRSSPRSYRLIALLSVLGKGLERILARRLAWTAIKHQVLHPQQFGALPARAASDLATCLIHDIEDARARGLKTTMLTLDIKGAFDAVLAGRLNQRLQDQGWPSKLIHWVASFTNNRTASLRLGDFTSQAFQVSAGLPQGSPISPILFMLFIEPLFKIGSIQARRGRFGYADDICQIVTSSSLETNTQILEGLAAELQLWGLQEGLLFDLDKTEIQHFSRNSQDSNPALLIHSGNGQHHIQPPHKSQAVRWLGIWFDRRLTFLPHCRAMAARARQTAAGIQSLANTARGVNARLLRQAVIACVLPVLTYGAEAWWPGISRAHKTSFISNGVKSALAHLGNTLRYAIRSILPAYRTTPIPILHRESAIPPMELILNHQRVLAHLRNTRLDNQHPVRRRLLRDRPTAPSLRLHSFRTSCLANLEQIDPILHPPWAQETQQNKARVCQSRVSALQDFQAWLEAEGPLSLLLFTDGSKHQSGATGAGWYCTWGTLGTVATQGHINLIGHEVFDAEAAGALAGLKAALNCHHAAYSVNLHIFLDNQEAALQLKGSPTGSSQQTFMDFQAAASAWRSRPTCLPGLPPGQVFVHWIPGHAGIFGNEMADQQANLGAVHPEARPSPPSPTRHAWARRLLRKALHSCFAAYWAQNAPESYRSLAIPYTSLPPELSLPRPALGRLLAARSGHGDFAEYHERFKHKDANLTCSCGQRKSPQHFFHCLTGEATARHTWEGLSCREVLGTTKGAMLFNEWLRRSNFYSQICPAY